MNTTRHDKVFKTSSPRTGRELDAMAGGGGGVVVSGSSGSGGGGGVRYHSELLGVVNSNNYLDTETAIHLTAKKLAEINSFYDKFLRKDTPDTAAEPITFKKGITVTGGASSDTLYVEKGATVGSLYVEETSSTHSLVVRRLAEILQLNVTEVATLARAIVKEFVSSETFIPGFAGEGFKIWQIAAGEWHGEIDSLTIRKSLNAFELLIQKYRAINGGLVISQGSGKIKSVTEDATHYLLEMEGDLTLMPDDFIRCQTWGAGEVESYPFDFTDSSKWQINPYGSLELVSEYTDHSFRINNILGTGEPGYILLVHGAAGGGGDVNISLKISGLAEGDVLIISNGTASSGDYLTITADSTYTFNYIDDSEGADSWTAFAIGYTTLTAGTKDILIEQIPEKKIETVTNKYYWARVDGIEEGKVKVLKSEFVQREEEIKNNFNDSSWVFVEQDSLAITHTDKSVHISRADYDELLCFAKNINPRETFEIRFKITGVSKPTDTDKGRFLSATYVENGITNGIPYKHNDIYTFRYTNNTSEVVPWAIAYQGETGECDITFELQPENGNEYEFDFNDKSFHIATEATAGASIENTYHSIHIAHMEYDFTPIFTYAPENMNVKMTLKITGVSADSSLYTVTGNETKEEVLITSDGVYTFEYTLPEDENVWGMFYRGSAGDKNILIEQLPKPVDISEKNRPATGDEVVQMGNATDVTRQALILLSATDGKPCIDLLAGVNSKSFAGKLQMRAGCLDGIQDSDFPATLQPSGYGLYCSNAFLKGAFVLRSGKSVEGEIEGVRTELTAIPGQITAAVSSVKEYTDDSVGKAREELNTNISAIPGQITAAVNSAKEYTDNSVGGVREELNTNISAIPGQIELSVSSALGAVKFGTRNYVLSSRMNRTDNIRTAAGGTVNLVTNEKFGTVVEFSRPDGGGEYQALWELSNTAELNSNDVVFAVIAKRMSETGYFNFGGWDTTFDLCRSSDSNQIDLGGGWIHYWATRKIDYIRGIGNTGAFGINSVSGTWRFYAVGVYKGNKPVDWTAAPEDLESRVSQAELNLQPNNIWLGIKDTVNGELTQTGINIATKEIAINAATTKIVSNGQVAALFTTDANGNPIIQGRFLKLTDGAEIGGFGISGKSLYNSDGEAGINIGGNNRYTYISSGSNSTNIKARTESASYPCASFYAPSGGTALELHGCVSGLAFKMETVYDGGTISTNSVYIFASGSKIYLPSVLVDTGRCIFVRNDYTGRITISGNGKSILYGGSYLSEININSKGEVFMFVYSGSVWCQNHMSY